jgi:hypothetical protein
MRAACWTLLQWFVSGERRRTLFEKLPKQWPHTNSVPMMHPPMPGMVSGMIRRVSPPLAGPFRLVNQQDNCDQRQTAEADQHIDKINGRTVQSQSRRGPKKVCQRINELFHDASRVHCNYIYIIGKQRLKSNPAMRNIFCFLAAIPAFSLDTSAREIDVRRTHINLKSCPIQLGAKVVMHW